MSHTKKVSLARRLMLYFGVFLSAQIVLIVVYGKFWEYVVEQNDKSMMENTLQIYYNRLDEIMGKVNNNLNSILGYRTQLDFLENSSELEKVKAQQVLLNVLSQKCSISKETDAYAIVSLRDDNILIQRNKNISYDDINALKNFLIQKAENKLPVTENWIADVINGKTYLLKYYIYRDLCIGAFLSGKEIASVLNYNDSEIQRTEFYMTDINEKIILASGDNLEYGQNLQKFCDEYPDIKLCEGNNLMDSYRIFSGIGTELHSAESVWAKGILIFLSVSAVFFAWIFYYVEKQILSPVKVLAEVSRKIHNGNWDERALYESGSLEMEEVRETYNSMLETIINMRVEQYEREIEIKDVQLKYMHMQLKPHYFLNALSTINSMAYQKQEAEIHQFIQAFSQNIRYMFRTGLYRVELIEEIRNVENYLEMQKLMYQDCFYVYMDLPEELEKYPVPQMILHTFMENLFKHVISIDTFTTVLVQIVLDKYQNEEMLKIEIHTSQKHFPEEIIREIQQGLEREFPSDKQRGIGLRNICKVMQIMYGKERLIQVENLMPDGTKIIIWIPKETKIKGGREDREYEYIDCR